MEIYAMQSNAMHVSAVSVLVLCMLCAHLEPCLSLSLFGGDDDMIQPQSAQEYGPVVLNSLLALRYAILASLPPEDVSNLTTASAPAAEGSIEGIFANVTTLPLGQGSKVVVQRNKLNSLFISFVQNGTDTPPEEWDSDTSQIPWMSDFLYSAEAPSYLLQLFSELTNSSDTANSQNTMNASSTGSSTRLEDAVYDVMGDERVLWVTCTGEGEIASSLAVLCGVASALKFPEAGVDVITFGSDWKGFNSQFSWAFDRLLSLYYLWPFNLTAVEQGGDETQPTTRKEFTQKIANSLQDLITQDGTLDEALTVPDLPPSLPDDFLALNEDNIEFPEGSYDELVQQCYDSYIPEGDIYGNTTECFAGSPKVKELRNLAPPKDLPAPGSLPQPSACPPILCRSRDLLDMSCTGFGADGAKVVESSPPPSLEGLEFAFVHDPDTSADAIVAWNDTSKEAFFLWKFTNESRDWVTDAVAYKTDNYIKELKDQFPGAVPTLDLFDDPQVHRGFYGQYNALVVEGEGDKNITQVLFDLNGGQDPLYVSVSGFSLGGAVSELHAVWCALRWPRAHINVATQGAPKVGNEGFVQLFKATVGQVYRYQFNLDEVPAIPPLSGYRTTDNPIWITSEGGGPYYVLLSSRPKVDTSLTTWYDHWCEAFYVPLVQGAQTIDVPQWIYEY